MEAVIAEGPPITVAELIDTSVDRTQRQFDDPDLHPWAARFNWRGLKASLSRLLQQRPVIIGVDGELIKPDWEGQIQIVNALANNWREELLGEEIIAIAREIKLTPSSDLANLAGALFLNRERKSLERVAEIINHLRSTGRIEVDADGVLRVLAHTPQGARRSLGIVPSVSNTIAQDEEQLA